MGSCGSCGSKDGLPKGCKNNGACATGSCSNKLTVFDWLSNIKPTKSSDHKYIEVRFKNDRKEFFDRKDNPVHIGDIVVVQASSGLDVGVVTLTGELVNIQLKKKKIKSDAILKVERVATEKDIENWIKYREKEQGIIVQSRIITSRLNLEMKICDAEYQGDGSKLTFYYTADGRVDFRQLIKEFAGSFKAKIDMRQIGFRQESAKVGGLGSCGLELCCSTWLTDFRSVNTTAARYQQLSINPQKLAGQCGKLKCCLNFELDTYMDALADFPSSQTNLNTEKGNAFCIKVDVFRRKMWYTYSDNTMTWYPLDISELKKLVQMNKDGKKIPPLEDIYKPEEIEVMTDIIEENNLNRFEKKSSNNKKKKNKYHKKNK